MLSVRSSRSHFLQYNISFTPFQLLLRVHDLRSPIVYGIAFPKCNTIGNTADNKASVFLLQFLVTVQRGNVNVLNWAIMRQTHEELAELPEILEKILLRFSLHL